MDAILRELQMKDSTLSVEMIDEQKNDYIVPAMNQVYGSIIDTMKDHHVYGSKVYSDRKIKPYINQLEAMILKRFGFKVKYIYNEGSGMGVLPVLPKNYNTLNRDIVHNHNDIIKALQELKDQGYDTSKKEDHDITDMENDQLAIYSNWSSSINKLDDAMGKDGVYIDLRKAYVSNMNKDYTIYLFSDLEQLTDDLDMSAEELTAITLHEIGHIFTHLEYSYRSVNNVANIIDTINENMHKKNKSYKETIKISYVNDLEGDVKDIDSSNAVTMTLAYFDKFIRYTLNMSESDYSATDSEQLADQFATRFGVGPYLSTALLKIESFNPIKIYIMQSIIVLSIGLLLGLLVNMAVAAGFVGGIALLTILGIIISAIVNTITSIITFGNVKDRTYDAPYERLKRIKLDMIKQLRGSNLSKADIKALLGKIDNIVDIMKIMPTEKDELSLIDKFMRNTTKGKRLVSLKEMDQAVEELLNNDLHVASNKLNMMKG